MQRTIVIGDVHGCIEELEELLQKLQLKQDDKIIFVGDLINKGPHTKRVLEKAEALNAIVLLGNHELGFLKYLENKRSPRHTQFEEVISDLGADLPKWRAWMRGLPTFYETDDFLVVHAGVIPGVAVKDIPPSIITRVRTWDGEGLDMNNNKDPAWYDFYAADKLIVYGHWANQGLFVRENTIGLDSGCVWGGALSAVILPERTIIQVKAKRAYRDFDLE
ncbi:MAG: hypothetical protein COW00_20255 [Bdellovibrio sp. CG12_big_fil_rev_8_21_14_0_65_39_13]|nr:MAG: hypothetical protein COW78_15465 [Bdellovibrio sp. CG22_combo_CG10-13_8_21_14_all_39_27]PIQ57563.1 MAG: hypothetical protein COW00_20255 [Bdellovibrio sp. CG12_big_fil_rev_8_21_14_0_65_39_13]PIR33766.1 MAG: hypothetical protein COV37_15345 [Bdellovibrio sp. CG11_big_fil_rev_8_21_14_0_20_39_38]PJB52354.1 MAG: hypothetical protein CO099_13090 [Bdellovibrio sp. CG_4_9_14_3_um_filter_39_7]